jgi:hypothetical protein
MIPTVGDSSTLISTPFLISAWAKIIAVIHPAEPPPTITILRISEGTDAGLPAGSDEYE